MIRIALTGSIGMGKSTAGALLRRARLPVHEADRVVHRLLGKGGAAVAQVAVAFPAVATENGIDRPALARLVFGDDAALARLEQILHPLVRAAEQRFLAIAARRGARLVVLDIPLLFESHAERRCDATLVVSAPAFLQRLRVMRRPHMDERRFAAVLKRQMPDAEKRRRADFVVLTGLDKRRTLHRLKQIVMILERNPPSPPCWSPHARNRPRHRNHRPRP